MIDAGNDENNDETTLSSYKYLHILLSQPQLSLISPTSSAACRWAVSQGSLHVFAHLRSMGICLILPALSPYYYVHNILPSHIDACRHSRMWEVGPMPTREVVGLARGRKGKCKWNRAAPSRRRIHQNPKTNSKPRTFVRDRWTRGIG